MTEICYINGAFVEKSEAMISVLDHGLLYGDGVFEGIRAYNGYVFKLQEHVARLFNSAQVLGLNIPMDPEQMAAKIIETARRSELKNGYIRPIVTRGAGRLGISPSSCARPTVIVLVEHENAVFDDEAYEKGIRAMVSTFRNPSNHGLPATAKTLNYGVRIMARMQALAAGSEEAVLLDEFGNVAEGSVDNVFVVYGNTVVTPPVGGILPGITREWVLSLAEQAGFALEVRPMNVSDLYTASEMFLTGTASEIVPVAFLDGRAIGTGVPGPVTRRLRQLYKEAVGTAATGTKI
ncbi:branched-chain-amino-acid transaminase [Candidatus Bipolaricaulota bacterium]|nr:branched-chain-amino-acid transaminase [Candidatus Bipolaricaulota bacterium]